MQHRTSFPAWYKIYLLAYAEGRAGRVLAPMTISASLTLRQACAQALGAHDAALGTEPSAATEVEQRISQRLT
jgi:hypothetical protein